MVDTARIVCPYPFFDRHSLPVAPNKYRAAHHTVFAGARRPADTGIRYDGCS